MLVFFIVMTIAVQNQLLSARVQQHGAKASEIASIINNEVRLAEEVNRGYTRTFFLPASINGYPYVINASPDGKDVIIKHLDRQYVYFVDGNASRICPLESGEMNTIRNYQFVCS